MRHTFLICSAGYIFGLGLLSLVFLPPFLTPDASGHWGRIDQMAHGSFIAERLGPNAWGGPIDGRSVAFLWKILPRFLEGKPFGRDDVEDASRIATAETETFAIHNFPNAAAFPPLGYLPQTAGYALARSFGLSFDTSYYAASLFNLIAYIGLVTGSMLLRPDFRRTILAIASMPTAIIQAASISGDCLNNAYPIFFMTAALRLGVWPILGMSIGLALLKPTAILYGLVALARRHLFVLVPSVAVAIVWTWYHPFNPAEYYGTGGNAKAQLSNLISFPVELLHSLGHNGILVFRQFYGQFGGIAGPYIYLPGFWLAATAVALWIPIALNDGAVFREGRWVGGVLAAVGVINIMLIIFLFWLVFTPPDLPWIEGFQGRYFIAPAAMCLVGLGIIFPKRIGSIRWILIAALAANGAGLLEGIFHYRRLYDSGLWP